MKTITPFKKFQFFDIVEGGDNRESRKDAKKFEQNPDLNLTLNDVTVREMHTIDNYVFMAAKVNNPKNDKKSLLLKLYKSQLLDGYQLFSEHINHFYLISHFQEKYLVALGTDLIDIKEGSRKESIDKNTPTSGAKKEVTSIKIFDISKCIDVMNDNIPERKKTISLVKTEEKGNISIVENITNAHLPVGGIECFAVSPDFTSMAIGLRDGNVIVLTAASNFLNSKEVKLTYAQKVTDEPITNVSYSAIFNDLFLVFTTKSKIYKAKMSDKQLSVDEIDGERGALRNCFDMKVGGEKFVAAIEIDSFIFEYVFFDRGRFWSLEGDKNFVLYFKEYIAFSFVDEKQTTFAIYDPINAMFVYYSTGMNSIQAATYDSDSIFLLEYNDIGKKKKLIRLREKDNKEKFDLFYKKSFFEAAYTYAKNLKYEPKKLSEITKKHAEHLYKKGDYEKSIEQYIKTINFLDPSYVIQQFLDGAKLDFLISYLEKLIKNETMMKNCNKEEMKDYTALLLNCYIKQKKIEKLKEFVGQKDVSKQILETAIEVCKDTKETDLALSIAEKSNMTEAYIQILMELRDDYEGSLVYLENETSRLKKFRLFLKYGAKFLEKAPSKTMESLMPLISDFIKLKNNEEIPNYTAEEKEELKRMNYEDIISIFLTNEYEKELGELLDYFMKEDKNCPQLILHHRIELYLDVYKKGVDSAQENDNYFIIEKIREILRNKDYIEKIDKNYIMMLFKYHNFTDGIIELSEIMQLNQELLLLYMESHNYDKIIEICRTHGEKEMNYWINGLNYFINILTEGTKSYTEGHIKTILNEFSKNEAISPLLLMEILKKSKSIQVGTVKDVLLNFFKKNRKILEEDKEESDSNLQKIEKLEQEEKELNQKAKVFNSNRCSGCNKALNLPFVFFLCSHSFHTECLSGEDFDDTCCPICKAKKGQLEQRILQANESAKEHGTFALDLQSKQKKFNLYAKYLGKGIFDVNK